MKDMVGTWGLEPQTSTVSTPEFEVNRCTYKALVATKSPVGYGSSRYCALNVSAPLLIVSCLHSRLVWFGSSRITGEPGPYVDTRSELPRARCSLDHLGPVTVLRP